MPPSSAAALLRWTLIPASRYFHNGAAATLEEAIDFHDTRFAIDLTASEKADLVAFLRAL